MEFDFEAELSKLTREELERLAKSMMSSGVALSFHGKRSAMQIAKKVRPRQTRREPKLHVGSPEAQSKNMLIEGENLQAMVTLYKYRGQVDLIVTDPPYNTGSTSATTTVGTTTRTTRSSGRLCPAKMVRAIPSGSRQ
ncbi:DNA methylase N-4/N-6 domain-containing protein (plasmid) [Frigidibacter mobilis]|uniref:DNA methylase N-4/N-6 domain-containing protein n=1 Tax=Frigidibacter mobilis TaxID=1335048 RepID=A0A159Z8Z2_9RHOB|nr:DNA methylase N-4/N-6 domain-containing protein [Frigidibacter mobilis]